MAEITVIGTTVTLELSVPMVDPQNGLFWKQVWVGLQDDLISYRDLLNIQPDQRVSIDKRNGPVYELTVITPDYINGQYSALNKFDIITHEVEKGIMDHPKAIGLLAGEAEILRDLVKSKTAITDISFGSDDSAYIYAKMLLGGGTAKSLDFERTFKYSIVTSARYGTLVSEFGVKKLWTAAQISNASFSGIIFPPSVRFSLLTIDANAPDDIDKSVQAPGRTPNPLTETYKWRWLKLGAHVETLPSGKIQISQEFMGDMWSTWEYVEVT